MSKARAHNVRVLLATIRDGRKDKGLQELKSMADAFCHAVDCSAMLVPSLRTAPKPAEGERHGRGCKAPGKRTR